MVVPFQPVRPVVVPEIGADDEFRRAVAVEVDEARDVVELVALDPVGVEFQADRFAEARFLPGADIGVEKMALRMREAETRWKTSPSRTAVT